MLGELAEFHSIFPIVQKECLYFYTSNKEITIINCLIIMGTLLTLPLSIGLQDTLAQEREYPRLEDEHYIEVNQGMSTTVLDVK